MRTALLLLVLIPRALAQDSYSTLSGQPQIALERYSLPGTLMAESELLADLATRTGVAGSQLEGLRLRIALPAHFRVESVQVRMVDGVFLVRENSFLAAVGGFLMRLARLLLFGQLVDAGDGLKIPSTLWFVLLDGDPNQQQPISVKTTQALRIQAGDARISDHGDFIVCRLVAATCPYTALLGLEIRGRHAATGEGLRYLMPHLAIPPLAAKDAPRGELSRTQALANWLAAP